MGEEQALLSPLHNQRGAPLVGLGGHFTSDTPKRRCECGTSDGRWIGWRKIMTKTEDASQVRELQDDELDIVTGGVSDLGKYITKAVDDAL